MEIDNKISNGYDSTHTVVQLINEFSLVLSRKNEPLSDNDEFMQLTELRFLLKK
jgi:hypothetical protein